MSLELHHHAIDVSRVQRPQKRLTVCGAPQYAYPAVKPVAVDALIQVAA